MKKYYLLIFILVIAFILRFWQLDIAPSNALYGDELTWAYDSYSILKTGYSQTGDFLPWTFKMAEGRPPGYVYFSIPFVAIFGPSTWGARMLSVLSGVGIVLLMFYLGKILVNEKVGYAASFIMAISPWAIHLSRGGFETNFALFLTLLGTILFLSSKNHKKLLFFSALSFTGAIHTYPTYKMTVPLLILFLVLYQKSYKWLLTKEYSIQTLFSSAIMVAAVGLVFAQAILFGSEGRILSINVFTRSDIKEEIIKRVNYDLSIDQIGSGNLVKVFHNKILEYSFAIGENYLQSYSLDFLFLHGDKNPRHNPPTMGEMYLIDLLLVFAGLFFLIKTNNNSLKLMGFWLAVAPLPAAIISGPHALRNSLMLPPLILFSAIGLIFLRDTLIKKPVKYLNFVIIIFIIFQFVIFIDRYFFVAPYEFSRFWSYPAKLAAEEAIENKNKFDIVILADSIDNIEYAYPAYARVDPIDVINQTKQRTNLKQYKFKKFENVYIGDIPNEEIEKYVDSLPGSVLYIGTVEDQKFITSFEIIKGLDLAPAFLIKKKLK